MFGFLRKREKGSAYSLEADQERRLRKAEKDIARLKKDIIELFIQQTLHPKTGDEEDGAPGSGTAEG